MTKTSAATICAPLFKTYPKVLRFFVTNDGQAFESDNNAFDHAISLDKKNADVVTVERDELPEVKQVTEPLVITSEAQKELASRKEQVEMLESKALATTDASELKSLSFQLDTAKAQYAEAEKTLGAGGDATDAQIKAEKAAAPDTKEAKGSVGDEAVIELAKKNAGSDATDAQIKAEKVATNAQKAAAKKAAAKTTK